MEKKDREWRRNGKRSAQKKQNRLNREEKKIQGKQKQKRVILKRVQVLLTSSFRALGEPGPHSTLSTRLWKIP